MMKYVMLLSVMFWSNMAWAGQVNIPNTFTAGTKAKASEVNANFSAVKQAVDDNAASISTNTADIYSNASGLAAVQSATSTNTNNLNTLQSTVNSNTAKISTNTADIYSNASGLATVQSATSTNTNNLNTLQSTVNSNTAKISTNTADIYSNASGLAAVQLATSTNTNNLNTLQSTVNSNTASIQNNASAVLGNASNISTNTSAIAGNTAAIASVQVSIPKTYQVVDSYGNVLGDLIGASMYGQRTIISSTGFLLEFNPNLTQAYSDPAAMAMAQYSGVLYTSADCTGLPLVTTTINSGIVLEGLTGFVLNAAQGYYDGVYQTYYAPKNSISATVTANSVLSQVQTSSGTYDPYTGALITPPTHGLVCVTATYVDPNGNNFLQLPPYTINGYVMLPNDPAVTGIPNTIGFPLSIQKKP